MSTPLTSGQQRSPGTASLKAPSLAMPPKNPLVPSRIASRIAVRVPERADPSAGRRGARAVATRAGSGWPMPSWHTMWQDLKNKQMKSVGPRRARDLVESGRYILVDVRMKEDYDKSHASGALAVPLFREINMSNISPLSAVRAAALLVNGVKPVERNPDFGRGIQRASEGGNKGVILYCDAGGTMEPSVNSLKGKMSRSLKAAWAVTEEQVVEDVLHMAGGLFLWSKDGLPIAGRFDVEAPGGASNANGVTGDEARKQ